MLDLSFLLPDPSVPNIIIISMHAPFFLWLRGVFLFFNKKKNNNKKKKKGKSSFAPWDDDKPLYLLH